MQLITYLFWKEPHLANTNQLLFDTYFCLKWSEMSPIWQIQEFCEPEKSIALWTGWTSRTIRLLWRDCTYAGQVKRFPSDYICAHAYICMLMLERWKALPMITFLSFVVMHFCLHSYYHARQVRNLITFVSFESNHVFCIFCLHLYDLNVIFQTESCHSDRTRTTQVCQAGPRQVSWTFVKVHIPGSGLTFFSSGLSEF